ncbi:MAG: L-threonylcarbamoyladenylate synthase [Flavobacteriales bacterium]|jgi:tRNA threonylcarbamoyl adenosine modification protein (Sua5/YciO/YrdC/YwlC family)|nr:L-threonylcarbamoyladenylate synthase [Flavobacteriales bacterium]
MIIKLYEENPNERQLEKIAKMIRNGAVFIYPTDTVYGIGCDITNKKALQKVARMKGLKLEKANFSIVCHDLSHLSDYIKQIDNPTFKLLKRTLPGPYTFILNANSSVPKIFNSKKKTIGIRVPDSNIARALVKELGNPIVSTSLRSDDDILEYSTDPELIYEKYQNEVDFIIDAGYGGNEASTVVNLTNGDIEILREGKGETDLLY